MPTTTTRRRIDPANTTDRTRPVEDILHEIAYVLHVTRKVSRPVTRPTTDARPGPVEAAPPASSA